MSLGHATARACANIALAKYWGKSDLTFNLPAVPSISLTLDGLVTETTVTIDERLAADELVLDGRAATPKETRRVVELLDRIRARTGFAARARVTSENRFPTAAGLASSASGFAALAAAASSAFGLPWDEPTMSALARAASASAARSIYGGFVELPAGRPGDADLAAHPIPEADAWPVRIVVAVTARGPKAVGSTEAMERSRTTSPFHAAWVDAAPQLAQDVREGIRAFDLDRVGAAMEQSTLAFHACAMTAVPSIVYLQPATVAALATVRALRASGLPVYATMDAGPHVKALCHAHDAPRVVEALAATDGVLDTLVASPGRGVERLA